MQDTQKFIKELDDIKAMLHWSDRDLAAQVGVTPAMLSKWRNAQAKMSNKCKSRIIEFYMRIDWQTLERKYPTMFPKKASPPQEDRLFEYVAAEWQQFTPAERAEVIAVIEQIKERKNTVADIHSAAE